jgi:hypothetical protein
MGGQLMEGRKLWKFAIEGCVCVCVEEIEANCFELE